MGPLARRWYDGGCIKSILLLALAAVAGLALLLLLVSSVP